MSRLPSGEPVTWFIDRALGGKIAVAALRDVGELVRVHDEHFPQNSPDVNWLALVGQQGWIGLTKDKAIRHNPAEFTRLYESGAGVFVVSSGGMPGPELAVLLVSVLPKMRRIVAETPRPFVATVARGGTVELLLTADGLERKVRERRK